MVSRACARTSLILPLFFGLSMPSFCQFASITGRVVDPSGAVLPDVNISARNSATSVLISTTSNSEGYFALPNLPVGTYTVQAEKAGFNKEQTSDIKLQVGQTARLDLTLQVGELVTSVAVQGVSPVIQSETSSVGAVVESRQIL